jgi:hypothetical protein
LSRPPHTRAALLVLLSFLLAFAAATPAHGNGPCFCLCEWLELFESSCGEEHDGEGPGAACDEDVPLRTGEALCVLLPPQDVCLTVAPLRAARADARERAAKSAFDPGGTRSLRAAALALRI